MSGASANAAARRRRAGSDQSQAINRNNTPRESSQQQNGSTQKLNTLKEEQVLTPLQILQMHDNKISTIENSL